MGGHSLVVGLGASGAAVARALRGRGETVVVVEDGPGEASRARTAALGGVRVVESPDHDRLAELVQDAGRVVPSPGVAVSHPVFALAAAAGVDVVGEVELASRWTDLPLVAVTGTNGKTTVTTLVAAMLQRSGLRAVAAGNIGLPLTDAVGQEADVLVVEVSSFQLALTQTFRPRVAVWLNLAPDHLDWHPDLEAYTAAKARIWANQGDDDVAVVNADDPVVRRAAAGAPAAVVTFGLGQGDWRVAGEVLMGPDDTVLAPVASLGRALPHDLANALAAAAAATAAGATLDGARAARAGFGGLPHRVTLVGEAGGVRWYDDSKATNPHAVVAAVSGFDSVVLVAGGRNKGLDLSLLATVTGRVRAVVAVGEAAGEVEAAFAGRRPVTVAGSMDEAVAAAAAAARPGDAVLLSPGCASFDRYRSYAERGDDFARAVLAHTGATTVSAPDASPDALPGAAP